MWRAFGAPRKNSHGREQGHSGTTGVRKALRVFLLGRSEVRWVSENAMSCAEAMGV